MLTALMMLAAAGAPVTDCDRLAAHPSDPDRVVEGVARADMDLPAAIAACQRAVAEHPGSGRLNYQLARSLGYSGRGAEAEPNRQAAVAAEYPQALFVVGYLHLLGLNEARVDPCRAGDLVRRSALAGRLAGQIAFPHWSLEGRFAGCELPQDLKEMRSFLAAARKQTDGDFYQDLLIDRLETALGGGQAASPEE